MEGVTGIWLTTGEGSARDGKGLFEISHLWCWRVVVGQARFKACRPAYPFVAAVHTAGRLSSQWHATTVVLWVLCTYPPGTLKSLDLAGSFYINLDAWVLLLPAPYISPQPLF